MNSILIIATLLLLIGRISSTRDDISKKYFYRRIEKRIENIKKICSTKTNKEINTFGNRYTIASAVFSCIMIFYYGWIGIDSSDKLLYFMSHIQATMVIYVYWEEMCIRNPISTNIDDYKFNRFRYLFNVLLDYIYYPMVIYSLIK